VFNGIREPRLGEGISKTGSISKNALSRTVAAILELNKIAERKGAERIIGFGTEVFRRADNGESVAREIGRVIGSKISILPPEMEAQLAFRGAMINLERESANLVIDIGGGSTELARGNDSPAITKSYPIGAVVAEEICGAVPPIDESSINCLFSLIEDRIDSNLNSERINRIVGVGGTITTLAAIKLGLDEYMSECIHGSILTTEWLESFFDEMSRKTIRDIERLIPFAPKRADILLPGTAILIHILNSLNFGQITVSDRGARWAIIYMSV